MIVVVYHEDCLDGYGAAWSASKLFGEEAKYVPAAPGNPDKLISKILEVAPEGGKVVYMLDIAVPPAQLEHLCDIFDKVTILDHHETAIGWYDSYEPEENAELVFDQGHSGAVLAWKYFHREKEIPKLLLYIEDRDLWRWQLPDSEVVLLAVDAYPYTFGNMDRLANDIERLKQEGSVLFKYRNGMLNLQLKSQHRLGFDLGDTTYVVPAVNCSLRALASESCHELLKQHPEAPFVVAYRMQSDGTYAMSLRSREDFNVAEFAAAYAGGGGHPSAAGMSVLALPTFHPPEDGGLDD